MNSGSPVAGHCEAGASIAGSQTPPTAETTGNTGQGFITRSRRHSRARHGGRPYLESVRPAWPITTVRIGPATSLRRDPSASSAPHREGPAREFHAFEGARSRLRRKLGLRHRARRAHPPPDRWRVGPIARANAAAIRPRRPDRREGERPAAQPPSSTDGPAHGQQRIPDAFELASNAGVPTTASTPSSSPDSKESRPWTHRTEGPPRPRFRVRRSLTGSPPMCSLVARLQDPFASGRSSFLINS